MMNVRIDELRKGYVDGEREREREIKDVFMQTCACIDAVLTAIIIVWKWKNFKILPSA